MARNELTNQRPAYGGTSLECDSMLIRSAGHLKVASQLQYGCDMISGCRDNCQKQIKQSEAYIQMENHWSMMVCKLGLRVT